MTDPSVAAAAGERSAAAVLELLQAAPGTGDRQALAQRHRPLLHLHLTDRAAGLGQLLEAIP